MCLYGYCFFLILFSAKRDVEDAVPYKVKVYFVENTS